MNLNTAADLAFLENLDAPETQDLAAQAHARTLADWAHDAGFAELRDQIAAQLRDERHIAFCQEHRAQMYHFYQSEEWPKGVYRVCPTATYRAGLPQWEILFSVADFDDVLGDDVYLQGVSHYVDAPEQVLISLSAGGGDAAYTIEFDLAKRQIVPDGFHFPLSKSGITWRDRDSVWVCPAWQSDQCTASGYPAQVWLLRRGQHFADAEPVFRLPENGMMVSAWRYLDKQGGALDLIEASHGFYRKTYRQITADGATHALALPEDCELAGYLSGHLLVRLRSDWQRTKQVYRAGSLLAVKLHKCQIGQAHILFAPQNGQTLDVVETTRHFAVAVVLENACSRLRAWHCDNGVWLKTDIPQLPEGVLEITDQPWGGDIVYVTHSHFTTPPTLYTLDLQLMEWCVMRREPAQFDSGGIRIQSFQAASADGTAVPYFHVGKNTSPDTPTLVYVYGGFGMPQLPSYLGIIGRHWLARGGAFVLANVRGGEFGPSWHRAAQGVHKHKSVDDLLAVVHDLARRQLTAPQHTALQGGSNGALVAASAFCREPHSIGALVAEVPLTDMLRYPYLSAGASWQDEFGRPDIPEERAALEALSPLHNLHDGTAYPPALILTNLADDRVHPAHALKFYARLRAFRQPVWLYAPDQGGHSGGTTQAEEAAEWALILRFLQKNIDTAGGL